MSIGAYLYFEGNCRDAIDFYADAFQADKPKVLNYGDIPQGNGNIPDAIKNWVMHAEMTIAGDTVMFSDASSDRPVTLGNNVCLMTYLETPDQVQAVFDRLKTGGQVIMGVQKTFFSSCYAYLVDKFGVSWQLSVNSLKD